MAERTPVVAYDARDFLSLAQVFKKYLSSSTRFNEIWTSFNPEDTATAYLELLAYFGDMTFIYQEWVYNQAYTRSMTTRRAAIDNGANVGYELASSRPATVDERLTFDVSQLPITVQARFQVSNGVVGSTGVFFEFDSDTPLVVTLGVLDGGVFLDLPFIEGRTIAESYSNSDGSTNQKIELTKTPVIDGTVSFRVNGIEWTEIQSLSQSTSSDEEYRVETDESGTTFVIFGDGKFGKIPPTGQTLDSVYRIGGGVRGRVSKNILETKITINNGIISVTNVESAVGGSEKETVKQARRNIPASVSTNDRLVTGDDISSGIALISGVLSVKSLVDPQAAAKAQVYIIPEGAGDVLSGSLITLVRNELKNKGMMGITYELKPPIYLRILVELRARAATGAVNARLEAEIREEALKILDFDLGNFTFGTEITNEDMCHVADKVRKKGFDFSRFQVKRLRTEPSLIPFDSNTGNLDVGNVVITQDENLIDLFMWELQSTGPRTFILKRIIMSRASEVAENVVTDGGANYVGAGVSISEKLRPRLDDPLTEFDIEAVVETAVTVEVDPGVSLQDKIGDLQQFGVVFTEEVLIRLGEAGSGIVSGVTFTDTTKNWAVNEWIGDLFEDSTGAVFTIVSNTAQILTLSSSGAVSGTYEVNKFSSDDASITLLAKRGTVLPIQGDIWWFVTTNAEGDVVVPDYVAPKVDTENDLVVTVYGGI